jgi:mRNA interferase MazF
MRPGSPLLPRRGEIWWVCLDPTVGSEIRKTRPCLVVSSDALAGQPVRVVVPLTGWKARHQRVPWCIRVDPDPSNGLQKPSAADALRVRAVSSHARRFTSRIGRISPPELDEVVLAIGLCIDHPPAGE